MAYHAFMSYSHAADGRLAPALHRALHGFAKPWYRLRALRIFRDKTNLHVTPRLWPAIQSALDQSSHFILLASPDAAASAWVSREVEHWLGSRPADRMLIVLTGGEIEWNRAANAFDARRTTALPPPLLSAFAEEPLFLDLRWARNQDDLSARHPRFREAVAELAAALHGRQKDELVGDDIRQHRRTRRLAASAIAGLCALSAVAIAVAVFAVGQRNAARDQRAVAVEQSRIALARQLAAQSTAVLTQFPEQLPLSVLLAMESTRLHASFETNQALRASLTLLPPVVWSHANEHPDPSRDRVTAIAFGLDGRHVAAARDDGTATVLDVVQRKVLAVLAHARQPAATGGLPGDRLEWKAPGVDEEVTAVAISPDGRLVATGSNDDSARLWDLASGDEIRRWPHEADVESVAFHPAGTTVATGSRDGWVTLFDVVSGRKAHAHREVRNVRTTTSRPGGGGTVITNAIDSTEAADVREVAFSPDGRHLAVVCSDGGVSLLDARTGARRYTWHAGMAGLGLAFSRDGRKLAVANGDVASVWDVETGKSLFRATHGGSGARERAPGTWIDDVAFSPDGSFLATAGRDATARVWNLLNGQERVRLTHPAPVQTVAFGPDGGTVSTGSVTGARLWDVQSGREQWRLAGAHEVVTFSPDGRLVASGGQDGIVSVSGTSRGDQRARMAHANPVAAVGVDADGARLATVDDRGAVRLWSPAGAMTQGESPVYGARRLAFSQDGRFLAATGRNPPVSVTSTAPGLTATALAPPGEVEDALVSRQYIVAIARGSDRLRVWQSAGGQELRPIVAKHVDALALDPTGAFLAFREQEPRGTPVIRVWDLAHGLEKGRRPIEGGGDFTLSPEGRLLAANVAERENGSARTFHADVWDVATGDRVVRIPQDDDEGVLAFDPSGTRLVTSGSRRVEQQEVRVWALPAGRLALRLTHQAPVEAVRFAAAQDAIATLSDGSVYLWSFSTGALIARIADAARVTDFAFNQDGRFLFTGAADGVAALWPWKVDDLRAEACRRLTRNLSASEWGQYLGYLPYQPTCPNLDGSP